MADLNAIRQPGSGVWLLENKAYLQWKRSTSRSPILWLSGDPGIGKTVLSSLIVKDIEETTSSSVAYYRCDANNDLSRTRLGLLSSIIAQLKAAYQIRSTASPLPQCLVEAYQTSFKFGRPSLSLADSPDCLVTELVRQSSEAAALVIDGLDEMDEPERVIENILQLVEQASSLRILFLSRHTPTITKKLAHLPRIQLSPTDLQHDIRSYVSRRAKDLPIEDLNLRQKIVEEICSKAEGMFLWAKMVVDELVSATSPAHIKTILHQCPPGLYAMYEHFLRIVAIQSPKRRMLAYDILRWVVCAARPLTVDELHAALTTNLQDQAERPFRHVIAEACSPFITISDTGGFVRAVHESVREYLTDGARDERLEGHVPSFQIEPKKAHYGLAVRCVNFLNTKLAAHTHASALSEATSEPFLSYALASWCHHTISGSYHRDLDQQITYLLGTSERRQFWLHHMIFVGSGEAFPSRMILRLRARLSEWSSGGHVVDTANGTQALNSSATDWTMDALEVLLKLQSSRNAGQGDGGNTARTNIDISYFEKMMVMRDLARRLTAGGFLSQAVARLEEIKAPISLSSETRLPAPFILNILGLVYDQQGYRDMSRDAHLEALSLQEAAAKISGKPESTDLEAVWSINELGRVYRHLGDLDEALKMHKAALTVLNKALAPDQPERLWTMATMARALREKGLPQEALELQLEVYQASCKSPGELHPHTLWTAGDIAKCYLDMGQYEDALSWFQRALDGRMSRLGPDDPDTLWSMNHIGLVLEDLGRHAEAMKMHRLALEGQIKVLGEEHAHTRWTQSILKGEIFTTSNI